MSPQLSIVIPTYNRCELLREAVESCRLAAPALELEIIVVDDASREDVRGAASGLGVRYERLERNSGSSVARNQGTAMATGDYVKFLDSDDVLCDLALQAEHRLAVDSGADIVVSGWQVVDLAEDGSETLTAEFPAPVFGNIPDDLLRGVAAPTSSALYCRRIAQSVPWDPELSKLNDWDYFVCAAMASNKIATVPLAAYRWRQHSGERIVNTSSFLKNSMELFRILEKLEQALAARGELTEARKRRLAQYLYKELRGAYRFDPPLGRSILLRIRKLDPHFKPRDEEGSAVFRLLGSALPLHPLLSAYGISRRIIDRAAALGRSKS